MQTAHLRDPYLVKSVIHSSQLLLAFQSPGETLPLREIVARSGLSKTMVFRLLYTLEKCGMVEKTGENLYQSRLRPFKPKLYRVGYASQGTGYAKIVSESIQCAAQLENIELISLNNRYNAKVAQRNADLLVREKVDLVIEFQTDENIAALVAAKYAQAKIPLIAIDIPHPGATYYGANNYEAGLVGGRYLGRWAKHRWQSSVDEIVLLELPRAGSLPKMRLTGMLTGLKESLPALDSCAVTYLDGDGQLGPAFEAMRRHLKNHRNRRILVCAINDDSALGALRAFQEAGSTDNCAIIGQNASPEVRHELRQPGTRLVGSVAFFPERYGEDLIRVTLDILNRRTVPSAVFVKHQLITPDTVDRFYPNDQLL